MAIRTVGPNSSFPSITAAMAAAGPNDTILLESGYGNEFAMVTHSGMTISGDASSIGIVLQLATGIAMFTLTGAAPINLLDATDGNGIVGNDGNNVITVTDGADAVDGGLGTDRLVVDYHLATGAVTGNSTSNFAEAGGSRLVTITDGTFEHFTVLTGSGADTITTGAGDDIINAGNGANTITAGQGANSITGGSDADTITGSDGGNFIDGGNGTNVITSGGGNDTILSGSGTDTIIAGGGNDEITARGGADTSNGGAGDDRLIVDYSALTTAVTGGVTGGNLGSGYTGHIADSAGNSIDVVETENFTITTGSGNDIITTGDGIDLLSGGAGDDLLNGSGGGDTLNGGLGNDILDGGSGADRLDGGAGGADTILGGDGIDTVSYASSNSGLIIDLGSLSSWDGTVNDTLISIENATGSSFNDDIRGTGGDNVLDGGAGGADIFYGGNGSDTVSYASSLSGVIIDMGSLSTWDGTVNDTLSDMENAIGSRFNDDIRGTGGDNVLDGGAGGADIFYGGNGSDTVSYASSLSGVIIDMGSLSTWDGTVNDTLSDMENAIGSRFNDDIRGTGGNNVLDGAGGVDICLGGNGNDTFVFRRGEANGDSVADFAGNGAAAGDQFQFVGYGSAGAGAIFTQNDATHWSINSADGLVHDTLTLLNGASVNPSDFFFV